jgi:hypothetical protein
LRIWQRTAAKRAARQVETELAIEEREQRQRAYAARSRVREDSLLATAVSTPLMLGLPALRRRFMVEPVDVGDLDVPLDPPRRDQFRATGRTVDWLPWRRAEREHGRAAAETAYQDATAEYEAAEFDRVRRLSTAKRDHQHSQAAAAERLWADYRSGVGEAVERYARVVLTSRPWPTGFGSSWQLRCEPLSHLLTVEYELPGPDVVYHDLAEADAPFRYADVVAQIALRVLLDLFRLLDDSVVEVISFNGLAPAGPSLVSITVTRERWAAVPLLRGDAQAVLRSLDS